MRRVEFMGKPDLVSIVLSKQERKILASAGDVLESLRDMRGEDLDDDVYGLDIARAMDVCQELSASESIPA